MVDLDYPGPCSVCGSKGECEHRAKEAQEQGLSPRDYETDVGPEVERESFDPHEIDKSEKDIDK